MSFLKSVRVLGQSGTQQKARKATDSDENSGATSTVMSELSVLTYSTRSLREICEVIRKRLTNGNSRLRNGHSSVVRVLKTLTLIEYLTCSGSEEFVEWMRGNLFYIEGLCGFCASQDTDSSMVKQVRALSEDIAHILRDDELLERKRNDVVEFRSSLSTPGRKSKDTSHVKARERMPVICGKDGCVMQSRSLDFPRKSGKYSHDRGMILTTLKEEEFDVDSVRNSYR